MISGYKLTERLAAILPALLVIVGDRLSKNYIRHSIGSFANIPVVPGWVRIIHTENAGAAFGVLADGNPIVRDGILIGVSLAVLCFVAFALWGRGGAFRGIYTRIALSLILGGAVGNVYDRVVHGTVTDFIEVYHRAWSFPAFNVADSAITVGALMLLIELTWPSRKRIEEHATLAHK